MASATDCPCETKTSTRRSLATISSGLWRFLGIAVLLFMSKDIPQGGPVQWGWINDRGCSTKILNFALKRYNLWGHRCPQTFRFRFLDGYWLDFANENVGRSVLM